MLELSTLRRWRVASLVLAISALQGCGDRRADVLESIESGLSDSPPVATLPVGPTAVPRGVPTGTVTVAPATPDSTAAPPAAFRDCTFEVTIEPMVCTATWLCADGLRAEAVASLEQPSCSGLFIGCRFFSDEGVLTGLLQPPESCSFAPRACPLTTPQSAAPFCAGGSGANLAGLSTAEVL